MCTFLACPPGSYKMSSRQQECFPCPANSVAEEEGSVVCVCEEDHFRTPLDTPSAPCTRNKIIYFYIHICVCPLKLHPSSSFFGELLPFPLSHITCYHSCNVSFHLDVFALSEQFHVCKPIIILPIHSAYYTI